MSSRNGGGPVAPDAPEEGTEPDGEAPSEVTSTRLLRNTIVNGLANAGNALVTIALTPFLLVQLGAEGYGLWVLALGLTFTSGYLALADLGLSDAAVKLIAEARAKGDPRRIAEIASTTLVAFGALGLVIGAAVAALAPWLVSVLGVDADLAATARVLFTVVALEVIIELPTEALRAVLIGTQRYTWLRTIDVGGRLLWGVLVVVALQRGHGVVALGVLAVVVAGVRAVLTLLAAHQVLPGLRLRLRSASRSVFRETATYGSLVGGLRFLSVIYAQMDRVIVSVMISVAAVAGYEVAFRMGSMATLVLVMASSSVLPAASYNAARADTGKQRELYLRGSKYTLALAVPVCMAALLFADRILVAWVGPEYASSTTAARLFLLFPILAGVNQVGVTMLIGLGQARPVLLLQTVSVGLNLVLSILLAPVLGMTGVVLGTLIGGVVVWWPYVRLLLRSFEVDLHTWAHRVILPNLPGLAVQVAVGLFVLEWGHQGDRLVDVAFLVASSCMVNAATFVVVGLDREERSHLATRLIGRRSTPSPTAASPQPASGHLA